MKQYDCTAVQEFISSDITPEQLSKQLDDACYNLAQKGLIDRNGYEYGEIDEQIFYIRNLRDIFSAMRDND